MKALGVLLGTAILLGNGWSLPELARPQASVPVTVIENVRVFDGEKLLPPSFVVLGEGKIIGLGTKIQVPPAAEVIDGTGMTLLPGFFDAHVHVWHADSLKQSLVFGVTTVVDMFMDVKTMTAIKKMQASGRAKDMAHLLSPGILATSPGGHGTQYGLPIPTLSKPADAGPWVRDRIKEGSDFIKIIYDDGSAYGMTRPTLDGATVAAVIASAHEQDKLAIIHAATQEQCMEALEAGVDGLAHLFFDNAFDADFGRLAARKGAFVIPTLAVLENFGAGSAAVSLIADPALSPFLTPDDNQMLEMTFPFTVQEGAYAAEERAIHQLMEAGVPILTGTDAPNPGTTYGASLHRELELLVQAGLPPLEALRSATSVPAETFGLSDRGRIRIGKTADCVLVEGDPTQDIKATRRIVAVWRAGVKVDRDKYRSAVEKSKKARERQRNAPPPEGSGSGLISDFEKDVIQAEYGAGWSVSTDAMTGGKSTAEYRLAEGGAAGSRKSLLITGTIAEGAQNRWAGAFFSPGTAMMQPANLSAWSSISFWARGDGKTYSIMIFAQSLGYVPAMLSFEAGPEWEEFTFPFEEFSVEGFDIMGIFIGGSAELGDFELRIDNVRLGGRTMKSD
jgi:imidazolonepropionase-like amidohydrolase